MKRFSWPIAEEGLFCLLYFLFVWLVVDARLVHHALGVLVAYYPFSFHLGWPYLAEHLGRPGGGGEYAVRFLTEFYGVGWFGALLTTALAWAGWRGADAVARLAGWPHAGVLRYLPPLLLAILLGRYSHPLGTVLALWAGVGGFLLYVHRAPRSPAARVAWVVISCILLHWLAGLASLELAVLVALYEVAISRRPAVALAALVSEAAIRSLFGLLAGHSLATVWGGLLAADPGVLDSHRPLAAVLYAFFPLLLLGAISTRWWWLRRTGASKAGRAEQPRSTPSARSTANGGAAKKTTALNARFPIWRRYLARPEGRRVLVAICALGASAGIAWYARDVSMWTVLAIDYYSQQERWEESLEAARHWPPGEYSFRCQRNVMLALYHTGRLGDEMFRYPQLAAAERQQSGAELYSTPGEHRDMGEYFQESRLLLELGCVNQAEKCACEALETCGDLPAVLEALAIINVVKGRPKTARIFYHALARHPLHRSRAMEQLRELDEDPRLSGDPRVTRIRRNRIRQDRAGIEFRMGTVFQSLLEANPENRMAFEFLMAAYLASGRSDRVAANVGLLEQFGFRGVPRHYQEAVAMALRTPEGAALTGGYRPDPRIVQRMERFERLMRSHGSPQEAAQAAIDAGLGDSYFFYLTFGTSGM